MLCFWQDTEGDFDCEDNELGPGCESYRYAGMVLQVNLHYDNTFSFDTRRVRFWYTVTRVEEAEFKGYETQYEQANQADDPSSARYTTAMGSASSFGRSETSACSTCRRCLSTWWSRQAC